MPTLPRSLAGRLLLASMVALLLAIGAAAAAMAVLVWPRPADTLLRAEVDEELRDVHEAMRLGTDGRLVVALHRQNASVYDAMPGDAAYRVLDANGQVVAHSRPGTALDALAGVGPAARRAVENNADPIVLSFARGVVEYAGRNYRIEIARSHRLVATLGDYAGEQYVRAAAVTVGLALLTFAVAVYLTLRRMLRPIDRVSQAALHIGPRNLGARLDSQGLPSELLPLIKSFNAALARLENGYRVQQEFLAAAAHELKTPLALLQAEIELGGAADTRTLLRDTAVMARQVHQLLHLAEVSEGHNYVFTPLRLRPVLADAADYLARLAAQRGLRIELDEDVDEYPPVEADASAVFVLAKNLLENAIHHAPPGTVVRVELSASGFAVRDAGPGVAAADRPKLFERFWRGGSKDSEGAGLGLAICMEICLAHGWSIALEPHASPGACFRVETCQEPQGASESRAGFDRHARHSPD